MADAGFNDRRFPDGRVLRLCSSEEGTTISAVGRQLGTTRQGASKVVGIPRDRGFLEVDDSVISKREKSVVGTAQGIDYLRAKREATDAIEVELRAELGELGVSALMTLLDVLGQGEQLRLQVYLRRSRLSYWLTEQRLRQFS
jgi:DNA-binding MarR family transcriptional regulator